MGSKLQGNGLFESSRMMLPEHVEALNRYAEQQRIKPKKRLAQDELEEISRALQLSMRHRISLTIKMYDQFEDLRIIGIVESISKLYGRFRVGDDWFMLDDIQGVEMNEEPC